MSMKGKSILATIENTILFSSTIRLWVEPDIRRSSANTKTRFLIWQERLYAKNVVAKLVLIAWSIETLNGISTTLIGKRLSNGLKWNIKQG